VTRVLLSLGSFKFTVPEATYNEIEESQDFSYTELQKVGGRTFLYFGGLGLETISLQGETVLMDDQDPRFIYQDLKAIASGGKPQVLIDAEGRVLGEFVIRRVNYRGRFIDEKSRPKYISFSMELARYERVSV
jgi:phage protein U